MSELIDRDETIKQFCKQDCGCDPKDCPDKTCYEVEIIESVPTHPTPSNTLGALDCVERQNSKVFPVEPISYLDCSNAMLKMWMDNVVTDGEYNRIMDKLNKKHEEDMRGENE